MTFYYPTSFETLQEWASENNMPAMQARVHLQQPIRNRTRRQDLLDIAVILRMGTPLDGDRVAEFLQRKTAARDVPVSRATFHAPEIIDRASQDYAALAETTRLLFVPFDEARGLLYAFVETLPISAQ